MKAIVYYQNGPPDVLKLEEIEKPLPKDDEVLVKVRAASANPLDWRMMRGGPFIFRVLFGLGKPKMKRPGVDVAGVVEAVGRNITQLKAGDAVFGTCKGAFAEYVCAPESALTPKPDNVTFEEAASVPVAGFTALQGLRDKGHIQPGHRVLINGAAGGVGTFAVQIAKAFGADVTGVCSTKNLEMVRSIGADRVIDYTKEDFTRGSERFDLILDCIGNHSLSAYRRILTPNATCVVAGAKELRDVLGLVLIAPLLSRLGSQKFLFFIAKMTKADLVVMHDLMATGKVRPVIDQRYKLSEVPKALAYLEQGHARGKVVITLDSVNKT